MPLIVVTGLPASGKSVRAAQIQTFFQDMGKTTHLVSERACIQVAGYDKNEYFRDSQKEKLVRSNVKSDALRLLNKDDLIIIDAGNYIKGYRYEIFCASKSSRTTQCTVYCAITKDQAWSFNEAISDPSERYQKDVFEELCLRYEEPQHNNRWDSPLFTLFPEEELNGESIYNALYMKTPLVPNLSTQNPPLGTTNFLFEVDRTTQDIIDQVLSARKLGLVGPVKLTNVVNASLDIPSDVKAPQLNRCRRQFLNYVKLHTSATMTVDKIPSLFVQYLNSNCV